MLNAAMRLTDRWTRAVDSALHAAGFDPPPVAPTAREVVAREGASTLYRLRPELGGSTSESALTPLVLVPSLINRWWVLDLCPGHSLAAAMGSSGRPVFVLDWGVFDHGDRTLGWGSLRARLHRMLDVVRRTTAHARAHLAGFSIGGTLALTHAALAPTELASLTLLAAPVDFARAGAIARWTDARWFDPRVMTSLGNVHPWGVLSGFAALQPGVFARETLAAQHALWLERPRAPDERRARHLRLALARWLYDGVPFPARAYEHVVGALYQRNELFRGSLCVDGAPVTLASLRELPVLAVTARDDVICPPAATLALFETPAAPSTPRDALSLTGSHVTGMVGERAAGELYAPWRAWLALRDR